MKAYLKGWATIALALTASFYLIASFESGTLNPVFFKYGEIWIELSVWIIATFIFNSVTWLYFWFRDREIVGEKKNQNDSPTKHPTPREIQRAGWMDSCNDENDLK